MKKQIIMHRRVRLAERPWQFALLILQILMFAAVRILLALRGTEGMQMEQMLAITFDSLGIVVNIILFFGCMSILRQNRVISLIMGLVLLATTFLMLDAAFWTVNGVKLLRWLNIAVNTLDYCCGILLLLFYEAYLCAWLEIPAKERRVSMLLQHLLALAGGALILGNLAGGYLFTVTPDGVFQREHLHWISYALPVLMIGNCGILLCRQKKLAWNRKLLFLCYPALPFILVMVTDGSADYVAVLAGIILLFSGLYIEQEQELARHRLLLTRQRVDLLASQMQSHFVSNTLLTIRGLYREDTEKADAVMDDFIGYIRYNCNDLAGSELVPAGQEWEHCRRYTNIEQVRFPDITVEYSTEPTDFCLPPMTLQPIVENAIRHGLMPLESGGSVKIAAGEDARGSFITVEDNGVGFDPAHPVGVYEDHRQHIGIPNVRDRLRAHGGELRIESAPGKGTKVTLRMPKVG